MDPTAFTTLLIEAAGLAELDEVAEVEEGRSWVAAFASGTVATIETDEGLHRLTLSADVGLAGSDTPAGRLRAMLAYNAAWRETGGLRLALSGEDVLVLLLDLPTGALDARALAEVLHAFATAAEAWTDGLESDPEDDADRPATPEPQIPLATMMRA